MSSLNRSNSKMNSLVKEFCSITGATEEVGCHLLDACGGNLEMAIGMHMDSPAGASASPAEGASARPTADDVRAPIPQKREVLVEDHLQFENKELEHAVIVEGPRPKRRAARSVFDGFRDFQAEAREQAQQEAAFASGSGMDPVVLSGSRKRKTLEDLFRPPIDLLFKGSFQAAKENGCKCNKWLMINVQNVREFQCQALNRDLWSNEAVRSLISRHFILWQVYSDSEEGKKYMQYYKVHSWPYVAVLDPQTGENLFTWTKVDPISFCDLVGEFLATHSTPSGASDTESPPGKRSKRNSIVDASEDSQLQAAIQASLSETSVAPVTKVALTDSEEESDEDDQLETFTDSDEDCAGDQQVLDSDDGDKVEEKTTSEMKSKKHQVKNKGVEKPAEKCEQTTTEKTTVNEVCDKVGACKKDNGTVSSEESVDVKIPAEDTSEDSWKKYLGNDTGPKCNIMFRFPDGKRSQLSIPQSSSLRALVQYAICQGYSNERYELVTTFPRRKLSYLEFDTTLAEIGLHAQETVFVQER